MRGAVGRLEQLGDVPIRLAFDVGAQGLHVVGVARLLQQHEEFVVVEGGVVELQQAQA